MFNFSRGLAASIMSVLFLVTMSVVPVHQVSANSLIDVSEAPSVIQETYEAPSLISSPNNDSEESSLKSTINKSMNFGLAALGFLCVLAILISVIATPVLLILWIIAEGEKSKKRYGRMTLISAGLLPASLLFIVLVFFLFAGANLAFVDNGSSDDMSYDEFLEEYGDE